MEVEITKEITIGVDVVCNECGKAVEAEYQETGNELVVFPCDTCTEKAKEEAR